MILHLLLFSAWPRASVQLSLSLCFIDQYRSIELTQWKAIFINNEQQGTLSPSPVSYSRPEKDKSLFLHVALTLVFVIAVKGRHILNTPAVLFLLHTSASIVRDKREGLCLLLSDFVRCDVCCRKMALNHREVSNLVFFFPLQLPGGGTLAQRRALTVTLFNS